MAKRENFTGSIVRRKRATGIIYEAFAPAQYVTTQSGRLICSRELLGRFPKRSEARQAIDDYIRHPTSKYNFTLLDLHQEWSTFAFRDISKQTQDNYTSSWAKICECPTPQIAGKLMREITTGDLRRVLDFYQQERTIIDPKTKIEKIVPPLSRSYITKLKALLTQLYNYAMENNIVDKNYAALVKLSRQTTVSKKRSFTDLEFAILEKRWKEVPGGDAVYALCYLGFRVTEFCELTPFAYDQKQQTLRGGIKTDAGRDRLVPVHSKIKPIVDAWYDRYCATLYADEKGKPYNKDKFLRRVWRPAMAALGLPDELTPHCARHTCGTRLSAAGARPEDIQRIMGHEDYSMTANTYINQDLAVLQAAMNKMA